MIHDVIVTDCLYLQFDPPEPVTPISDQYQENLARDTVSSYIPLAFENSVLLTLVLMSSAALPQSNLVSISWSI